MQAATTTTYVIRQCNRLWVVEDAEHGRGGAFVSLAAALAFARREVAGVPSARFIIVGP